jgi:RHS repeat-associated protein
MALSSIRALTSSTAQVVDTQTYDAYGSVRASTGTTLPFGFAGEQTYPESGLIYLRARYLDPTTGRFLTQDSAQSGWVYGYANDNPVLGIDPTGQAMMACDTPDDCGSSPVGTDPVPWQSASSIDMLLSLLPQPGPNRTPPANQSMCPHRWAPRAKAGGPIPAPT